MISAAALAVAGQTRSFLVDVEAAALPELVVVVTGEDRDDLLAALRAQSSRAAVRLLGRDVGYRVEDLRAICIAVPPAFASSSSNSTTAALRSMGSELAAWLERRIGHRVDVVERPGPTALAAIFAARVGGAPSRERYAVGADGRVRVEAFELHVAEHCNLRCANCCNMSPLVAERSLSIDLVRDFVTRMAQVLHADVVKIMGGEPLLHPHIAEVIHILRASGIGDRVRLFTNGLLLASQPDAFWEALDELTISNYTSAPCKPATLALARERSRRHDFVLNVKPVDEFTQVLSSTYHPDPQQTFDRCWLRHRCLVVRNHTFYTCTRAAYADDFLAHVAHEPPPHPLDRSRDGLPLSTPDLATALAAYLDREEPLGACHYCFGGDGAAEPHYQLSRADVLAGLLRRVVRPSHE